RPPTGAPIEGTRERMASLAEAERAHIVRVLESVNWNKKQAAGVLEISRGTLYRKTGEYALAPGAGGQKNGGKKGPGPPARFPGFPGWNPGVRIFKNPPPPDS